MSAARLVLLHGFTQGGGIWVPVMERLTVRCPIDAPDLPGHGAASDLGTDMATTADELVRRFGRGAWVGYSMGGRLALHVALRHPEAVSHLVLCSTTAGLRAEADRADRRASDAALADRIRSIGLDAFLGEWLAQPLFATLKPDRIGADIDAEVRAANTVEGLATSLEVNGTGAQDSLWDSLAELSMPVLVVTGGLDRKFGELGEQLVASIGDNATHTVVPHCGHAVPFEDPATFSAIVDVFLRRHS